jgi:SAM-dependent methyltransferase
MVDSSSPNAETEKLARLRRGFLVPSKGQPAYLERLSLVRALRELADLLEHGVILDLGCGVKPYESLLARPGDRWVGVDNPPTMQGSYGRLTQADVFADCHQLPFADGYFDSVICTQVLEHVPEPERVLRETARVLRPGGVLILTAPMVWPLHEEPYDFFRYTRYGLRHLLGSAGLEVIREVQRGRGASALGQMLLDLHFARRSESLPGKVYRQLCCRVVNQLCLWLDRLPAARRLALGWAVAARKRPSAKATTETEHSALPAQPKVPASAGVGW